MLTNINIHKNIDYKPNIRNIFKIRKPINISNERIGEIRNELSYKLRELDRIDLFEMYYDYERFSDMEISSIPFTKNKVYKLIEKYSDSSIKDTVNELFNFDNKGDSFEFNKLDRLVSNMKLSISPEATSIKFDDEINVKINFKKDKDILIIGYSKDKHISISNKDKSIIIGESGKVYNGSVSLDDNTKLFAITVDNKTLEVYNKRITDIDNIDAPNMKVVSIDNTNITDMAMNITVRFNSLLESMGMELKDIELLYIGDDIDTIKSMIDYDDNDFKLLDIMHVDYILGETHIDRLDIGEIENPVTENEFKSTLSRLWVECKENNESYELVNKFNELSEKYKITTGKTFNKEDLKEYKPAYKYF